MRCAYKVDAVQCVKVFAHDGSHEVPLPAPFHRHEWPYDDYDRAADKQRGAPECGSEWMQPGSGVGEVYRCRGPLGHKGVHTDGSVVWTDQQIDEILNPAPVPEPEIPERPVPLAVQAELRQRARQDTYLLAVRGPDGQAVRYDVIGHRVLASGALDIETATEDVIYAPHAWSSLTAEPVER